MDTMRIMRGTMPVYRESNKKIYIPRFYGIQQFGKPDTYTIKDGDDIQLTFKGSLRDFQHNIIDAYFHHIHEQDCALLDIPCGFGKTVCALHIISRLAKKTLVIVHKDFLMQQWKERIQEFLPDARIGKIQGPIVDIDDKDKKPKAWIFIKKFKVGTILSILVESVILPFFNGTLRSSLSKTVLLLKSCNSSILCIKKFYEDIL